MNSDIMTAEKSQKIKVHLTGIKKILSSDDFKSCFVNMIKDPWGNMAIETFK